MHSSVLLQMVPRSDTYFVKHFTAFDFLQKSHFERLHLWSFVTLATFEEQIL